MKKLLTMSMFAIMLIGSVWGKDTLAGTSDGRVVILHDDGTWENLLLEDPQLSGKEPEVPEGWTTTRLGSFKIERFWTEGTSYVCSYTLVSYKNTTSTTFNDYVIIKAMTYTASGSMIDTNIRGFFAHEYSAIIPGFEGTVKIPIEGRAASVKVVIENAR